MTGLIQKACKQSRMETQIRRDGAYWYDAHIGELRRECIKSRRKFLRARGPERITQHNTCKENRKKLNDEIRKAKDRIWRNLCNDISNNPWNVGFKIVTNKLKIPQTEIPPKKLNSPLKHCSQNKN